MSTQALCHEMYIAGLQSFNAKMLSTILAIKCDLMPYFVHLFDPFSLFSTTYPLIGLPPSLVGGSHVRVIESSVVPSHSGSPGFPGGSVFAINTSKHYTVQIQANNVQDTAEQ